MRYGQERLALAREPSLPPSPAVATHVAAATLEPAIVDAALADEVELALLATRVAALVLLQGQAAPATIDAIERALAQVESRPPTTQTMPLWHAALWSRQMRGEREACEALACRLQAQAVDGDTLLAEHIALDVRGLLALTAGDTRTALQRLDAALERHALLSPTQLEGFILAHDLRLHSLCNTALACVLHGHFARAAALRQQVEQGLDEGTDAASAVSALWYLAYMHYLLDEPLAARRHGSAPPPTSMRVAGCRWPSRTG